MVNHGDDVLQRAEVLLEQPGLDLDVRHKGLSAEEWAIRGGNPALATLIASEVSWSDTMRGGVTIGETTPATITMRPSVLLLRSHRWWIACRPIVLCGFHILMDLRAHCPPRTAPQVSSRARWSRPRAAWVQAVVRASAGVPMMLRACVGGPPAVP